MTVHAWSLTPQKVRIVSDTLVTKRSTGEPLRFASKCRTFPHIAAAICGVGDTWPPLSLVFAVEDRGVLGGGIDDAAEVETFVGDLVAEHGGICMIFGWSRQARGFTGLRLEEPTGFKWAAIPHGVGCLPLVPGLDLPADLPDVALVKLAEALVGEVNGGASPDPDDAGSCGGELIMTELSAGGITQRKVKRFDHYEDLRRAINGH